MKRTFHTDRKAMVKAVSEALGIPSKYLGAPTMSYQIGSINIDRNGTLTTENKEEGEKAMAALKEQGIIPEEGPVENTAEQAADLPPIDSLEISIPRDKMTEDQLNNLKKLVEAKSTLIRHAFQTENTDLTVTDDKIIFPWFQTPCSSDEAFAYTTFVGKLCEDHRNGEGSRQREVCLPLFPSAAWADRQGVQDGKEDSPQKPLRFLGI